MAQRLTLAVLLGFVATFASAGQWRESPCVEDVDENGNTCSDYKRLQEETDCQELVDLIDGEKFNGNTLHCHCACPEWYEPIPDTADGCDDWTENKRCPEQFNADTFDYHPLGEDDEDTCLQICSNMPGAVCCLFRDDGKCYSHKLSTTLDFVGKSGARASICNVECPVTFDVTLYDDGEDGWGDYYFNIQTSETAVELSDWVRHTKGDVYKSTHSMCVREETPCYTAVAVPRGGPEDAEQAAQIHFEVELDGVLLGTGNASYFPHFGLSDGHACPSRLFKRLGRYSLKEFEKVGNEYLDATKAYRNIARKAEKLGLFRRPVKKMGAVWPEDADWVPTTTTTTDPFGIGDDTTTTTTTTVTYYSDYSVLVTDGTSCADNGHCSIMDIDSCEEEATKWGMADTAATAISKTGQPAGCQLTSGTTLRFNDVIAGNRNSPSSTSTMICRLCTATTTTTTTTVETTTEEVTTTTVLETTEEIVRTAAATTEDKGRLVPAPSPYEVITEGLCYQYELCRVADADTCDDAADSLGLARSSDISKAAKPGGCLLWTTGTVKFNDQLDSGVTSSDDAMVICYACDDFKAPAPSFTRKATTEEVTRDDVTTEEARIITTDEVTRKVTQKETTNRHIDYVTKDAGVERCRPDYCALESKEECEAAAEFTGQTDTKADEQSKIGQPAGCYVNTNGALKFNTRFFVDDAGLEPNLKVGDVGAIHLCEICAPAPAPSRPDTTEAGTRGDVTTEEVVRTIADTTEEVRTTTTVDVRSYYYDSTEERATGGAYDVVVDTDRPDSYESTTLEDRGAYYDAATDPPDTTTGRGGGGGGGGDTTTRRGGGGGGDTTTGRGGGGGDTTTGRGGGGDDTTTGRGGGGGDTTTGRGGGGGGRGDSTTTDRRGGDSTTARGGPSTTEEQTTTSGGRGGGGGRGSTTDRDGGGGRGSTTDSGRGSTTGAGRGDTTTTGRPIESTTGRGGRE